LYVGLVWRILPLSRALIARDRDRVKAVATRAALSGRSIEQVDAKARGFALRAFPAWLRDDTVKRLRWHRSQGHKVVLVSASYSLYLTYLGKLLGCDAVMGTECETNSGAQFTGSLVGANCRGAEKERRLREWLDEEGFGSYVLYAYGDSAGDDHMLAMADHAFRITKECVAEVPELSAA
jgi:HAD superfamily hydrolase (TIGR01490 family)